MSGSIIVRELFTRWGFNVDTAAVERFQSRIDVAKKGVGLATKAIAGITAGAGLAANSIFHLTSSIADNSD